MAEGVDTQLRAPRRRTERGAISVVDQECPLGRRRDRLAWLVRFILGDSDKPRQRGALPRVGRCYAHANSTQATQ
jgi:hypothetical protein